MEFRQLEGKTIYLMPVGMLSLSLFCLLQSRGISVAGICDNSSSAVGSGFRGLPVLSPQEGYQRHPDAIVIICNYTFEKGIRTQLADLGFSSVLSHNRTVSQNDLKELLEIADQITGEELTAIAPRYGPLGQLAELEIRQGLLPPHLDPEKALILSHTNLVITDCCTLRCRSCSSWMQHFSHPRHLPAQEVCQGLVALLDAVDFVRDISIQGGEPLIHPELEEILSYALSQPKIGVVNLITNGTRVPSAALCRRLASASHVKVTISNYGALSHLCGEAVEQLQRYGVRHWVKQDVFWYDYAHLIPWEGRSREEVEETYRTCPLNCAAMAGRHYSRCQVALSSARLEATPFEGEQHTDLVDVLASDFSGDLLRDHLADSTPLAACRVCSGKGRGSHNEIRPAIQASHPLAYTRYPNR